MPKTTIAALAVACLAASIAPASAGGLAGNVLSLDGDHDALVNVGLDNVVSDSVGDGNISIDTNTDHGIGGTADIGDHRFLDVDLGGGDGADVDVDLGLDDGGSGGLLGLGGVGGVDPGDVAGVGDVDGLTDGLNLDGLDIDGLDLGGAAGTGGIADVGNVLDDADIVDLGGVGLGNLSGVDGDLLDGVDLSGLELDVDEDLLTDGGGGLDL